MLLYNKNYALHKTTWGQPRMAHLWPAYLMQ